MSGWPAFQAATILSMLDSQLQNVRCTTLPFAAAAVVVAALDVVEAAVPPVAVEAVLAVLAGVPALDVDEVLAAAVVAGAAPDPEPVSPAAATVRPTLTPARSSTGPAVEVSTRNPSDNAASSRAPITSA